MQKINSIVLNVKARAIKLLKENLEYLCDFESGKDF